MHQFSYSPPWSLQNGLAMTLHVALKMSQTWEKHIAEPEPDYQPQVFVGAEDVPIFGKVAIPQNPRGTIVATYGITGDLDNQWFLKILGRKAFAQGYAIVLFDWRAHGKTAELSPTLTSDGLYEGEDFVRIAAKAKAMGCPAPFWFTGYSLGGQLALWAIKSAQTVATWGSDLGLAESEIAGGAAICPSLESQRSLSYLDKSAIGRSLDQAITKQLRILADRISECHPGAIDPAALSRVHNIWTFDEELVIGKLGFATVGDYYKASSPLYQLDTFAKPTLILYAADDPMFDPTIVPDLEDACAQNPAIDLVVTEHGGHVGYISSKACQQQAKDPDIWWAWNRVLEWFN
ncbi:MAG: alpha/beta fold hydrolase [Oscillatoriophycideae cyanobacterium NC_groundwater_1537_Pr4_S-0.65um_50_18]|nr:alpha/beta fold hydrolase [Oscillatoriophycideae cyanobacterium NC_groundwater_1537_Pr4_S-0.65um_50_18]